MPYLWGLEFSLGFILGIYKEKGKEMQTTIKGLGFRVYYIK